jgi:hypothetical protein
MKERTLIGDLVVLFGKENLILYGGTIVVGVLCFELYKAWKNRSAFAKAREFSAKRRDFSLTRRSTRKPFRRHTAPLPL